MVEHTADRVKPITYVLRDILTGMYVADDSTGEPHTKDIKNALKFVTFEAAMRERLPAERIITLEGEVPDE